MTILTIFEDIGRNAPIEATDDPVRIAEQLASIGIGFERHPAPVVLPPDADAAFVMAAYATTIDRLMHQGGYQSADAVRMVPTAPNRRAVREKYLGEHTHSDDEVRFFVEGSGIFYMHAEGKVVELRNVRGDLIRVPAGAPHWFDAGETPFFTAIRLFTRPDGWVGAFTGNPITSRFVIP
jgi:1,2-dihydroxy-3-keto-5-methylthiopentene dioxygenase